MRARKGGCQPEESFALSVDHSLFYGLKNSLRKIGTAQLPIHAIEVIINGQDFNRKPVRYFLVL